ncbi:S1 family peptidase, partial [Streptomyces sp. NPDC006476]|uniref:S1 family peptidase n=1 Tax=Streptomyces sp. NPDC006476 TaxID=3157175 RepID=UPI0033AEB848
DPKTNQVVVTADRTVSQAEWTKLTKVVDGLGEKAELKRTKGEFKLAIAGGDKITGPVTGGTVFCSLGFNVVKDGQPYFITAGHCTNETSDWFDAGQELGFTEESSFPDNDFGLVKYSENADHPSEVNLYNGSTQTITKAGDAIIGQEVTRSGTTTQVHSGTVTNTDATVNYDTGDTVNGLIEADVCADHGDSGGPLFSGDTAIGLTSGINGNCTSGGVTFFQPVTEALSAVGAQIG